MMRRLWAVLLVTLGAVGCGGGGEFAIPADAQKTASGISWVVLQAGTGTEHPVTASTVLVHYTGWTTDGAEFDSSVRKGEPFQTPLTRVIPGWTEGVQLLVKGEKRRFWIPAKLAYEGMPGRPQGVLIFDIELLDFK
jgi:peptidylprolyl isomerase